jgi:phospholipid/cholesterol/gamma-HCH transport system substrate-binding protein
MSAARIRLAALLALTISAIAVAATLLTSGSDYTVTAQFTNAGRLVTGGQVRVAGSPVGSIKRVALGANGLAEVTMSLSDLDALPAGTRARIRAVGAGTLTNNFVELLPGPKGAAPLADHATIPTTLTEGLVDVDAVLSAFDADTRRDVRALFANGAEIFAGSGSRSFNDMLAKLDPAVVELGALSADLAADETRLGRFVATAADAATAVASRRSDLVEAVDHTATTLNAVRRRRAELETTLTQAPRLLAQAGRTLDNTGATIDALRPTLRQVPPAARELTPFLDGLLDFLPASRPVLGDLNTQLPHVRDALQALPGLTSVGAPTLTNLGQTLRRSQPILRGVRFYAPDFLIGIFNGLLTIASGNYNKYGHYVHLSLVQSPQDVLGGALAGLLTKQPLIPGLLGIRTGITDMCPGGAAPPAPDGSSPYVPDPALCDPAQSTPASVNSP